jgi:AraC family transcriptional regulator, positive regulator of tynA and feaB
MAVSRISTAAVAAKEGPEFWQAAMQERFSLALALEPASGCAFHQSMALHQYGIATLGERHGTPFKASWKAEDNELVIADINHEGRTLLRHNGNKDVYLQPRSISLFPLAESTTIDFLDKTHHTILALPAQALSEFSPAWRKHAGMVLEASAGPAKLLLDLAISLQQHGEQLGKACRESAGNMLLSLLGSSLASLEAGTAEQSTRMRGYHLQQIRNYAITHLSNPQLDARMIATGAGLSLRYVHSLFADEPLRLMQWVQEQRLCRCQADLVAPRHASRTIAQIGYAWGFNDAAHFSRVFQKRFGMSPSEFRANARRKQG